MLPPTASTEAAPRLGAGIVPPEGARDSTKAVQRVVKVRRDYNGWVARETMEDYALRFTPRSFRKWSALRVANTAFGASSFLVLEAVGGTLLVDYGFINAFWAILATGLIIFLAGWPISVYAARHGVDMDLLTRGAGFGYIGSTITSLIYASFTFIFFALEAAIMAYAHRAGLRHPARLGLPAVLAGGDSAGHARRHHHQPAAGVDAAALAGDADRALRLRAAAAPGGAGPSSGTTAAAVPHGWPETGLAVAAAASTCMKFGAAMTVGIALITQMGEQADYLRFMPEAAPRRARRAGGPR